jgi:hypothetical protein
MKAAIDRLREAAMKHSLGAFLSDGSIDSCTSIAVRRDGLPGRRSR